MSGKVDINTYGGRTFVAKFLQKIRKRLCDGISVRGQARVLETVLKRF